ncbi:MAG: NPCBM/NEW2 domain-containing protein [Pirellulales bacterium]|nr:NPCBM/NEW2 domain-containing protein [Pirellulales bacterium]
MAAQHRKTGDLVRAWNKPASRWFFQSVERAKSNSLPHGANLPIRIIFLLVFVIFCLVEKDAIAGDTIPLSSLDLSKMDCGWGNPCVDTAVTGKPLSIAGKTFHHGVGTHADSVLRVQLDGKTNRFLALVGVDDGAQGKGTLRFRIFGDGKILFDSGLMKGGQPAKDVAIDLAGVRQLILLVDSAEDGIDYDHADWAEAVFEYSGGKPLAIHAPEEPKVILTPPPGPEPKINGPRLFGVRPGRPFLYRIPCTGERPITFGVEGLPGGLQFDPDQGIITGRVPNRRGEYAITLKARNALGYAEKKFTIVAGDTLALTPPMGWNSWYIHYNRVTEKNMRDAADAMIDSGMADFGYMYVNIDDCWMKHKNDPPYRDQNGAMLTNAKFPDIRGMVAAIHGKGLRAGLYTSPGPWTCAGYAGSFQHESIDAKTYAEWGFDFLKYDWCSYSQVAGGDTLAHLQEPYQRMGDILQGLDRDIVLNLCQYGMGSVWEWGGAVGGHCWRTTGDLGLQSARRLPGFYVIGLSNAQHWKHAKPGQWNDPDYILIGHVGDARKMGEGQSTTLTANEQYSYMSMWCLMAAPLIFSGDMSKLDEFTLNVLCNSEVIAVDQDPLGKQAQIFRQSDTQLVLVKPLEDGSLALGLFNLDEFPQSMAVTWDELGLDGPCMVRDLWRQQDMGYLDNQFEGSVPRHGVLMLRIEGT